MRGGARARGEGPGVRTVPADRPGEAAVPEREQGRRWEAGVQTVGPAERAGQGNRCTEPLTRPVLLSLSAVVYVPPEQTEPDRSYTGVPCYVSRVRVQVCGASVAQPRCGAAQLLKQSKLY